MAVPFGPVARAVRERTFFPTLTAPVPPGTRAPTHSTQLRRPEQNPLCLPPCTARTCLHVLPTGLTRAMIGITTHTWTDHWPRRPPATPSVYRGQACQGHSFRHRPQTRGTCEAPTYSKTALCQRAGAPKVTAACSHNHRNSSRPAARLVEEGMRWMDRWMDGRQAGNSRRQEADRGEG